MTTYLLAGGGTAGHVNPLLAVADALRARDPDATVLVLGTSEGLESRLVPERGYELLIVPRLPFPRRPNRAAVRFLPRFNRAINEVAATLRRRQVDVVVGFGGYVATPAYLAARRAGIPIAIHEAMPSPAWPTGSARPSPTPWASPSPGPGSGTPGSSACRSGARSRSSTVPRPARRAWPSSAWPPTCPHCS